jgi:glyoxylase-like metal-dependent hydrolase (beta-lactamase superfamily II)
MSDDLIVEQFRLGLLWNFVYLVGSRAAGEALVVDPGAEVAPVLARAAALSLRITAIIATHFHTDHTAGADLLARRTGASVLVHHADAPGLRRHYHGRLEDVADGQRLRLGGHDLELWHAPGHTPGSQWLVADGAVFTGDSLMIGCVGRTGHEPDAVAGMWWTVGEQFSRLPDDTRIYPGHDYGPERSSTVARERRRNPALRASTLAEFRSHLAE